MSVIKVKVIQPTATKIDDRFDHIIIPGLEGDLGVSEDHTPFITQLRSGVLRLYNGESIQHYAIHDGFCTIEKNEVIIVCEVIEHENEIDSSRAEKAKERAESRIKSNDEKINFRRAEAALKRALTRLEIKQ